MDHDFDVRFIDLDDWNNNALIGQGRRNRNVDWPAHEPVLEFRELFFHYGHTILSPTSEVFEYKCVKEISRHTFKY